MPRTQEQYAQMRDASNQKIYSAALRLFAEKGYGATSIDDIAKTAGLSKGMVYRHYKSKKELFSFLFEAALEGTQDMTRQIESGGDPREIFESIAADIYQNMTDGEDFLNLMMLMTRGLMSKSLPDYQRALDTDLRAMDAGAKLIRRGQRQGVFGAGNPKEMIVCFFSCIQGLVLMKSLLKENFHMPDAETMTALLYRGLSHEHE